MHKILVEKTVLPKLKTKNILALTKITITLLLCSGLFAFILVIREINSDYLDFELELELKTPATGIESEYSFFAKLKKGAYLFYVHCPNLNYQNYQFDVKISVINISKAMEVFEESIDKIEKESNDSGSRSIPLEEGVYKITVVRRKIDDQDIRPLRARFCTNDELKKGVLYNTNRFIAQ